MGRGQVGAVWKMGKHSEVLGSGYGDNERKRRITAFVGAAADNDVSIDELSTIYC